MIQMKPDYVPYGENIDQFLSEGWMLRYSQIWLGKHSKRYNSRAIQHGAPFLVFKRCKILVALRLIVLDLHKQYRLVYTGTCIIGYKLYYTDPSPASSNSNLLQFLLHDLSFGVFCSLGHYNSIFLTTPFFSFFLLYRIQDSGQRLTFYVYVFILIKIDLGKALKLNSLKKQSSQFKNLSSEFYFFVRKLHAGGLQSKKCAHLIGQTNIFVCQHFFVARPFFGQPFVARPKNNKKLSPSFYTRLAPKLDARLGRLRSKMEVAK